MSDIIEIISEFNKSISGIGDVINSFSDTPTDDELKNAQSKIDEYEKAINKLTEVYDNFEWAIHIAMNSGSKAKMVIRDIDKEIEESDKKDIAGEFWSQAKINLNDIRADLGNPVFKDITFIDVMNEECINALNFFDQASCHNGDGIYGMRDEKFRIVNGFLAKIHSYEEQIITEATQYLDRMAS